MIVYLHPHLRNNVRQDLVAQLVEHLPFKERVLGSSPSQITNKSSDYVGRDPDIYWEFCVMLRHLTGYIDLSVRRQAGRITSKFDFFTNLLVFIQR